MEIKFRGQRTTNNEWVYGDLIHGVGWKKGKMYILPLVHNLASLPGCDPLDGFEIKPETVGQYIGLKDKYNTEVYKDDILQVKYFEYRDTIKEKISKTWNGVVQWINYQSLFQIYDLSNSEEEAYPYYCLFNSRSMEFEIIGNTYQNPELMK